MAKTFDVNTMAVPEIIEKEITHEHALTVLGRIGDVRGRYHAIAVERRFRHPAVAAIAEAARRHGGRASRSAPEGVVTRIGAATGPPSPPRHR